MRDFNLDHYDFYLALADRLKTSLLTCNLGIKGFGIKQVSQNPLLNA